MLVLKRKKFSKEEDDLEEKEDNLKAAGTITGLAGAGILSTTKTNRLTGKVTRYHNTKVENVDNILKEGIKAKFSTDSNNITNRALKDVPMDKKEGLVYTAKKKSTAKKVGLQRSVLEGKVKRTDDTDRFKEYLFPKHSKTLKLEFDYDELKGKPRITNPELRGAKNWREFKDKHGLLARIATPDEAFKEVYNELNEGTHIFRGDIDSSHIVGGKGHKKRSVKQVLKYIKNNPKRFGKEAAKVGLGIAAIGGGTALLKKAHDTKKKRENLKKRGKIIFY